MNAAAAYEMYLKDMAALTTLLKNEPFENKAALTELFKKDPCSKVSHCMLSTKVPTKEGGYVQTKPTIDGKQVPLTLNKLVVIKKYGRIPRKGEDASHLCNRPKCLNEEHIVLEDVSKNQGRKGCLGYILCQVCNGIINVCTRGNKDGQDVCFPQGRGDRAACIHFDLAQQPMHVQKRLRRE